VLFRSIAPTIGAAETSLPGLFSRMCETEDSGEFMPFSDSVPDSAFPSDVMPCMRRLTDQYSLDEEPATKRVVRIVISTGMPKESKLREPSAIEPVGVIGSMLRAYGWYKAATCERIRDQELARIAVLQHYVA
jgi:hypothetical protein